MVQVTTDLKNIPKTKSVKVIRLRKTSLSRNKNRNLLQARYFHESLREPGDYNWLLARKCEI